MSNKQNAIINIFRSLVLIVLCLLSFSIGVLKVPNAEDWLGLFSIYALALTYTILYAVELKNNNSLSDLPVDRYTYLTHGFIAIKSIRLLILLGLSIFFLVSGKGLSILGFAILLIFVTDSVAFFYKVYKKTYCIALFANYIYFQLDTSHKLFVSEIEEVECRYGIFYLILKDKKVKLIEMEKINANESDKFQKQLSDWMVRNKVKCTSDTKIALKIAST